MCPTSPRRTPSPARVGRRTCRTVVVTVAFALVLAACGGGEDTSEEGGSAADQEPAVATTSPSPAPSGPPDRPVPTLPTGSESLEDDRAGRVAFAEHAVATWAYAIATNDPDPFLALAPRQQHCQGCRPFARELDRRADEGWFVALDRVLVTDVDAPRRTAPRTPVPVTVTLDIPATYALNDDRTFRSTNPAHEGATFELEIAWRRGGFVLLGYSLTT